jgi:hypothetical protein
MPREEEELIRKRQRERGLACWRSCSALFVVLMFCHHHRQDEHQPVTTLAQENRSVRNQGAFVRTGDARPRLRLGAALPPLLPGDRLWRHDDDGRGSAWRRRRRDRGPVRREHRARAAVEVRAGAEDHPDSAGRKNHASTTWRKTIPPAGPQAPPASTCRQRRPANISARSNASASPSRRCKPGQERAHAGGLLRRPETALDDPEHSRDIDEITPTIGGRSHAGRAAAPALRHDPVHRLGSDVLRRLVLGLLRLLAVPQRVASRRRRAVAARRRSRPCSTRSTCRCSTR